MDLVSASELRKERTAETPSALRKAVFGLRPLAVLSEMPPAWAVLPRVVVTKLLLLLTMVVRGLPPVGGPPPGGGRGGAAAPARLLPVWVLAVTGSSGQAVSETDMLGGGVPVQSIPLAVLMSLVVSMILASINIWPVALSSGR